MALIPSESLNFPDSFRAKVGWRLPKEAPAEPPPEPSLQWPDSNQEAIATPTPPEAAPSPTAQPAPVEPAGPQATAPAVTARPPEHVPSSSPAPPKSIAPAPVESNVPAPVNLIAPAAVAPVSKAVAPEPAAKAAPAEPAPGQAPNVGKPESDQPGLLPQASEQTVASAVPPLSVSGPAAQALIAQIFQMPPAADTKIEPVRPEPAPKEEMVSAKPDAVESKPAESVKNPPPNPSVAEVKSDHKPGFSLTSLPGDAPRHPSAATLVPLPKAVPAEPVKPPAPSNSEMPAQNNHILELIAAATQRGVLVNAPAAEPAPSVRQERVAPAAPVPVAPPKPAAPQAKIEPSVPDKLPTEQSPASTVPTIDTPTSQSGAAPKAPAKIRITPRKIKPRPAVTTPEPQPAAEAQPIHPAPEPKPEPQPIAHAPAGYGSMAERARPAWDLQPPGRAFEPWEARMPARKITAGRLDVPPEDFSGLFTPRDRRNRWIGFGLSEAAALTALILLLNFALTHKFPDPTVRLLVFILAFAAAAVALALPIAFMRNNPKRWEQR